MPKAVRVEKSCNHCGTTFSIKPSHDHQRYCSRACWKAYEAIHGRPAAAVEAVAFTCKTCGSPFSYKPAYVNEYRRKFGKDPMYCSIPCSAVGRRADTAAAAFFTCLHCGKRNPMKRYGGAHGRSVYYKQQKFCDNVCKSDHQATAAHDRFKSGDYSRHIKRNGYVWITVPSLVTGTKHETLEHRWVMSRHIGRELLPEETVHHVNGDRQFNDISNLELFSSRHGPGQRVIDKVAFAIEMLRLYPEFAAEAEVKLIDIERGC